MTTIEEDHHSEETIATSTGPTLETEDPHRSTETTEITTEITTEHRATTDPADQHHRETEQGR